MYCDLLVLWDYAIWCNGSSKKIEIFCSKVTFFAWKFLILHFGCIWRLLVTRSSVVPAICFNAGKSPLSKSSLLRVSSFLHTSFSKSNRLEADMSGVFLVFSKKYLRSGFRILLLVPCPVKPVIDFTPISNLEVTTLSMAVKIASCLQFLKVMRALLTTLVIWLSFLFSLTWFWRLLLSALLKSLDWPLACCYNTSLARIFTFTQLRMAKII